MKPCEGEHAGPGQGQIFGPSFTPILHEIPRGPPPSPEVVSVPGVVSKMTLGASHFRQAPLPFV